jgi:hypothetical protein
VPGRAESARPARNGPQGGFPRHIREENTNQREGSDVVSEGGQFLLSLDNRQQWQARIQVPDPRPVRSRHGERCMFMSPQGRENASAECHHHVSARAPGREL